MDGTAHNPAAKDPPKRQIPMNLARALIEYLLRLSYSACA
jgi:hypothetical protein